jgi:hypothetical protein
MMSVLATPQQTAEQYTGAIGNILHHALTDNV